MNIKHIQTLQCAAEIEAEHKGIYYTSVSWVYCRDGIRRLLPVFNSQGQRIVRYS